jgi:hypothetical protein
MIRQVPKITILSLVVCNSAIAVTDVSQKIITPGLSVLTKKPCKAILA